MFIPPNLLNLKDFMGEEEEDLIESRVWRSSSTNKSIMISDMSTSHILNSIKLLEGNGKSQPSKSLLKSKEKYLNWFKEELKKRNI